MASEKSFTAFLDVFFFFGGEGGKRAILFEKHGSFFLSQKTTGEKQCFFVCFCLFVCLLVGWLVGQVCWFVGLLVCWFFGLLVCLFVRLCFFPACD